VVGSSNLSGRANKIKGLRVAGDYNPRQTGTPGLGVAVRHGVVAGVELPN